MQKRLTFFAALAGVAFIPAAVAASPVARAPTTAVTISASPTTVVYDRTTTLSGSITPAQAGERVTVQLQACGDNAFRRLGNVDTVAGGTWTMTARPTVNTQYRARVDNVTSATVSVNVSPRVTLRKLTRRKFQTRVFAAQSLAGKVVTVQRFKTSTRTWVRVRRSTLRQVSTSAETVVSGITFRARVPRRARVRVVLTAAQAAPCYVGARSNVVRA